VRIGSVARLFRYPVKSMRGEELLATPIDFDGMAGDRRYAFVQAENRTAFPWLTGREVAEMVRYRPSFEGGYDGTGRIPAVLVESPDGAQRRVDDEALRAELEQKLGAALFLLRDHRGNYDSAQISVFSLTTAEEIGAGAGITADPRRFRANLYLQPDEGAPGEPDWVGHVLAVGPELRLAVVEQDARCTMINLDPDTAAMNPAVLRNVATTRGNCAGVYAHVLRPGTVRTGDAVEIVE
jgi:uncharacterized protein YcbX